MEDEAFDHAPVEILPKEIDLSGEEGASAYAPTATSSLANLCVYPR